jgi:hypothetical protein
VTRIRGEDYAALADGMQPCLMVETSSLRTRGPELVARRVEPWAPILDDHCVPVVAEPMRSPEAELDADQEQMMAQTGLLLATAGEVRVLSDQVEPCRAVGDGRGRSEVALAVSPRVQLRVLTEPHGRPP